MNILIQDILAVLPDGPRVCSIFLQNGLIASINTPPANFTADKTISGSGRLLIPGLINAHTHAYMTVFRNHADDLTFNDWLFGKIQPLEDKLTVEDCYWGTMLGCVEMLASGTTSFLDMYIFPDAAARAVTDTGMRACLSLGLAGTADASGRGMLRLREAVDEMDRWHGKNDNISFMLAPHAPYTCDDGYQREVAKEAKRLGISINTHLSESVAEIETIRNDYGCSPIELADKTGMLTETTVAAHCVHLSDSDIALLAKRGVTVATNPVSNLKLANGIAPVPKLMSAGVNVALGTDGAASNNALNMFKDLSFLTLLHKGISGNPQLVTAPEGLNIATVNGAKALGLSGKTGEIRPGLLADLAIINLDHPNMQPANDPVAALSYSASGSEVETVLVSGRVLMENRIFPHVDVERIVFEVDSICRRIGMK